MTTLRKELTDVGFNWDKGKIIYQESGGYSPGWSSDELPGIYINNDHPILDLEYNEGYGSPQCPRFIAKDDKCIYFPVQYDGATWIDSIYFNINHYTKPKVTTPYPGG